MKVASFDIFDTLLIRDVIDPTSIFLEVGSRLVSMDCGIDSASEYRSLRITAESETRRKSNGYEVTLDCILKELVNHTNFNHLDTAVLRELEIAAEDKSLTTCPEGANVLKNARDNYDVVIFVTDMYLSKDVIQSFLEARSLWMHSDVIFVSSEHGANKWSGKLFNLIRDRYPIGSEFHHFGDNPRSDVQSAQRSGWIPSPLSTGRANRYELLPLKRNADLELSKLLGAMRLQRINHASTQHKNADIVYRLGLEVVGPLLAANALQISQRCLEKKIDRLFFLSRDGQVILSVVDQLRQCGVAFPPTEYMLTSRQALRLPNYYLYKDELLNWIFEQSGHLSLRTVFKRLDLRLTDWIAWIDQSDWRSSFDSVLTDHNKRTILSWLTSGPIKAAVDEQSEQRYQAAVSYFRKIGLFDSSRPAICDVGWKGTMQTSIQNILNAETVNAMSLTGFYVGISPNSDLPETNTVASINRDSDIHNIPARAEIIELFLSADHGGVLRYRLDGHEPVVDFTSNKNDSASEWGLSILRQGISDFVNCLSTSMNLIDVSCVQTRIHEIAIRNLSHVLSSPDLAESYTIGDWPCSIDATHEYESTLAPELTIRSAIFRGITEKSNRQYWYPGVTKRSGHIASLTFRIVRRTRKLFFKLRT